jgi:PKD repeat protein
MKAFLVAVVGSLLILAVLITACEKKDDPFSSLNKEPVIDAFSFEEDSLKFSTDNFFKLTLKYLDDENQQLTATFKFLSGEGSISHTSFNLIEKRGNAHIYEVPSNFDGKINFLPDSSGKVEIELELSDKVKLATRSTETFFFKNLHPVANFTYEPLPPINVNPYDIRVDASGSYDNDNGQIVKYYWRFGDGTPLVIAGAGSNTYQHTYQNAGTYTVRLKVEDDDGAVDSTEQAVTTNNQSPLAVLQVDPVTGEAPLIINYTATNSTDPDGKIVSYRIDFDDGSSSLDSIGSHTYTVDKDYQVRLIVQDNLGKTDTTSILVRVATPPVAILKVNPNQGPFPLESVIDGTDSYDLQEGRLDHDIYIDGTLEYDNIDSVLHSFDNPKQYLVRLVVTSQRNGLTDEAFKSVTAINLDPVANFTWVPPFPGHQQPVTYSSTSSDPNLTDEISYYRWTFPFGEIIEGEDEAVITKPFDAGVDTFKVKLEVWDKFRGTPNAGYDFIEKIIPKNNTGK